MRDFAAGKLDVLVATTVIEVGVDVPNATMMVVLDADRFGVSQLHQLRGRVGRGSAAGLCLLVTEADAMAPARERLDAVASTLDGFMLAELDLVDKYIPGLTNEPTWPTLRAHLINLAAESGEHPLVHLQEATLGRDLSTT